MSPSLSVSASDWSASLSPPVILWDCVVAGTTYLVISCKSQLNAQNQQLVVPADVEATKLGPTSRASH